MNKEQGTRDKEWIMNVERGNKDRVQGGLVAARSANNYCFEVLSSSPISGCGIP